ncbi:MAG: hypothetical protein K2W96_23580 [Gemmataceae bacterium]|nr:hypothetical protein [Gemmataceae bacterium]
MPHLLLSLDAHDMMALQQGRYANKSSLTSEDLLATVESVLVDVQHAHGDDAALVRLDFLDDGTIHILAGEVDSE